MTKWKYTTVYGGIRKGVLMASSEPSEIWGRKDKSGKSVWDSIEEYGEEGWELVSVTPITENTGDSSYTNYLLYTFKKPIE